VRADVHPDDVISLANAIASVVEGDRDRRRRTRLIGLLIDGLRAPPDTTIAPMKAQLVR
jgi:hypothetical protein